MHFIRILTLALQLISGQLPQMLEAAFCHLADKLSADTRCASKHLKTPEQNNHGLVIEPACISQEPIIQALFHFGNTS